MLEQWYDHYESQCWYENTYLVNKPEQISQRIKLEEGDKEGEWNNIYDSGCNFVCLSMIIGINPAYLASRLKLLSFFELDTDDDYEALRINTEVRNEDDYLVWDINRPCEKKHKSSDKYAHEVKINKVFHPTKGLVDITLKFEHLDKARNHEVASKKIKIAHEAGMHVICGYEDHSRLVAGQRKIDGQYYLWDPDISTANGDLIDDEVGEETMIQRNLGGEYTIKTFFDCYSEDEEYKDEKAELWIYSLEVKRAEYDIHL